MDSVNSAGRPGNHGSLNSRRPVADTRLGVDRYKSSTNGANENRAPLPMSNSLNTMLKTATETGDTGEFIIKPTRPPPRKPADTKNGYALQRPQQIFQLPNGQQIDDRRRLPSYARDATSEIVSLYETASQKASSVPRVFEAQDHRSYSMTQTSYLPNALSNHRSYASLRSQPELGLVPRPRSPFLYPARLKRLGFRPSSPILPERRADCSLNSETERTPYSAGIISRSASPFNTYKKTFPLAQSEANKASPSVTNRQSSRSQSSILSRKLTNEFLPDSSGNPGPESSKALLPSSDFSLISTPIRYHRRSPTSFTATTNKLHTRSPLYYDYTEGFNIEHVDGGEDAAEDSPPATPFIVDRTIYEDREISSEASPRYYAVSQGSTTSLGARAPVTISSGGSLHSSHDKHRLNSEDSHTERSTNVTQDIIPLYLDRRPCDRILTSSTTERGSPKLSNTEDALNKTLLSKAEGVDSVISNHRGVFDKKLQHPPGAPPKTENENSNRGNAADRISTSNKSSFRLSTYLPIFPKPPNQTIHVITSGNLVAHANGTPANPQHDPTSAPSAADCSIQLKNKCLGHEFQLSLLAPTPPQFQQGFPRATIQRSATTHIRSSRSYSIDHGLTELAKLISNYEATNGSLTSQDMYSHSTEATSRPSVQPPSASGSSRMLKDLPFLPTTLLQLASSVQFRTPLNKYRSEGDLRASNSKRLEPTHLVLHEDQIDLENHGMNKDMASYVNGAGHSIPCLPPSLPPLYLLAPKPVSPTVVLKLKKSVPQLMKALPPVPGDPIIADSYSQQLAPRIPGTRSSPLDLKPRETPVSTEPIRLEAAFVESIATQQDSEGVTELEESIFPPPKFRIKSRFFDSQRSHSPANSRPWNLDESYPWYGQQRTIRLSSLRSMISGTQGSPKFKLRVTRASNSPSGTIRINPEARASLDLQYPKDLFTSGSSLSEIFLQVRKQFSSRKSSTLSELAPGRGAQAPFVVAASSQTSRIRGRKPDLLVPPSSPTTAHPTSPTEVRSFFSEDSSQMRGHNSLRKRISNLRARIPNPYASRPEMQSNEHDTWRERIGSLAPTKGRLRVNINSEQEDEYGMPIADLQPRKLRLKVSGWFRDARLAMKRHVKLRSNEARCMPSYR